MKQKNPSRDFQAGCGDNFADIDIQIIGKVEDVPTGKSLIVGRYKGHGKVRDETGCVLVANPQGLVTFQGRVEGPGVFAERTAVQKSEENRLIPDDPANHRRGQNEGCGCAGNCANCTCSEKTQKRKLDR